MTLTLERPAPSPALSTKTALKARVRKMQEDGQTVADLPEKPQRIPTMQAPMTVNPAPRAVNPGDAVFDLRRVIAGKRAEAAAMKQAWDALCDEVLRLERAEELLVELQRMVGEAR